MRRKNKINFGKKLPDPYQLILSIFLLLISIAGAVYFVYTATTRRLTQVEGVYLQALPWITGILASLVFGRMSAQTAAREIIRPHARSAFRRLLSLYDSVSRVASVVAESQESEGDDHRVALSQIEAFVVEQLSTADDAIEDWRDIVPDDVDELRGSIDLEDAQGARNG